MKKFQITISNFNISPQILSKIDFAGMLTLLWFLTIEK